MKYNQEWREKLKTFPTSLAKICINYKTWKKKIKKYSKSLLLSQLEKDVKSVDLFCKHYVHKMRQFQENVKNDNILKKLFYFIEHLCEIFATKLLSKKSKPIYDWNVLFEETKEKFLEFVLINRKSVQKICKKIDKRKNRTDICRAWYKNVAQKKYIFLSNKLEFSYLKFVVEKKVETCPICLEDDFPDFIILQCGHTMCMSCLDKFTHHILASKGTLHNILHNYQYRNKVLCPMCRFSNPFEHFTICQK